MSNNDTNLMVDVASLQSQDNFLSEFERSKNKDSAKNGFNVLSLQNEKLLILLVISQCDGIGAKELGQKTHLSRYAALAHSKQLIEMKLLTAEMISAPKSGIKPAYLFHLAPGVTREVLYAAARERRMKLPKFLEDKAEEENISVSHSIEIETLKPKPNLPESTLLESQMTELYSLKIRLLALSKKAQEVLRLIGLDGITTSEVTQKFKWDNSTSHKYLKQLFDSGWLIRKSGSTGLGRGEYVYSLASGLTKESIEMALDLPESNASTQQTVQEVKIEASSTTPVPQEISPPNNIPVPMQTESTDQQGNSTESNEDVQSIPSVIEAIEELIVLYRRVTNLEQNLRAMGGEKAERLINTLRGGNFEANR